MMGLHHVGPERALPFPSPQPALPCSVPTPWPKTPCSCPRAGRRPAGLSLSVVAHAWTKKADLSGEHSPVRFQASSRLRICLCKFNQCWNCTSTSPTQTRTGSHLKNLQQSPNQAITSFLLSALKVLGQRPYVLSWAVPTHATALLNIRHPPHQRSGKAKPPGTVWVKEHKPYHKGRRG